MLISEKTVISLILMSRFCSVFVDVGEDLIMFATGIRLDLVLCRCRRRPYYVLSLYQDLIRYMPVARKT